MYQKKSQLDNLILILIQSNNFFQFIVLRSDLYHQDAIDLLKRAGIDFNEFKTKGINQEKFASLLIETGLVLNENMTWILFHGGFDLGYLIRLLSGEDMPKTTDQLYRLLSYFFPNIYDIKFVIKDIFTISSMGLSKLASHIGVDRIGPQHQAGSDSLITLAAFFQLKKEYFSNSIEKLKKYSNVIFGLGPGYIANMEYLQNYKNYSEDNIEQQAYNIKTQQQQQHYPQPQHNQQIYQNIFQNKPQKQQSQQFNNNNQGNSSSIMTKFNLLTKFNKTASQDNRLYSRNFTYNNNSGELNQDNFYHQDQINTQSFQYIQSGHNNFYSGQTGQNNDNKYWRQYQNALPQNILQRNLSDINNYQKQNLSLEEQSKTNLTSNFEGELESITNKMNRELNF